MMMLADLAERKWDVVIIGAGPAGSILSLLLARWGLSVLLVDQSEFPRRKVCGGCLNGNSLAALQQCGLRQLPVQLGAEPVRRMQLCFAGRRAELPFEDNWSLSRERFDWGLLQESQKAGVTFVPGVRGKLGLVTFNCHQVQLQSSLETQTVSAKVIVLAHGLKGGAIAKHSRVGAGVVLDRAPEGLPDDGLLMVVGQGGYVGGVRVEDGQYDLAAALDASFVKASGTMANAVSELFRQANFPKIPELQTASWKGTPLLTRRSQSIAGERWFAVGDAAGYVEPFTGEGMAWAMNGALALAPLVQQSVRRWQPSVTAEWAKIYSRTIARRQWPCRVLSKVLRSPLLASVLVRGLQTFPKLAEPILHHLSRPTFRPEGVIL